MRLAYEYSKAQRQQIALWLWTLYIIVSVLIVLGGAFAAIAGIGILRLPDVLIRMHASTKAGTLGVGLMVLGVAVHFNSGLVVTKALLIIAFLLLLTAPVATHPVVRAYYRRGLPLWEKTLIDDAAMKQQRTPEQ